MAGEFTVKILSPEDFNKLPFKRIQENPDSIFGAAEMATKTAYVKDTGFNDLTKANIGHELDELMAATSPHEEDGIRYKGLGDIFGSIGSFGKSAVGAVGRGISNIGGAIGSGVSALGRGVKNVLTPGPAAPRVPGLGGEGFIQGTAQAATPAARSALTGGAGTAANFAADQAGAARPGGGGGGIASFFGNLLGGGGSGGGGGDPSSVGGIDFLKGIKAGGGGPVAGATPDTGGNFLQEIFSSAKANPELAGSLISGIGDLFSKGPGDIDISGLTGAARSRAEGQSPTALFGEAEQQLIADLRDPTTAPPASAFERGDQVIEEDLADQIKALEQQFKAATGSADVANNSAFLQEKSRLEERARERRAAVRDEISFQFTREQLQRDLQEIELALNLDTAQTTQLIQLAQLDAEALAFNHGLDLKEAQEFKELFGNFGDLLLRTPEEQAQTSEVA